MRSPCKKAFGTGLPEYPELQPRLTHSLSKLCWTLAVPAFKNAIEVFYAGKAAHESDFPDSIICMTQKQFRMPHAFLREQF